MKCKKCHVQLEDDALFCSSCGTKVLIDNTAAKVITVGRSSGNNIVVQNSTVSSHHAQFKIENNVVTLEDLNSTNKTFVNGKPIIISKVNESDTISFGKNYIFNWNELQKYLSLGSLNEKFNKQQTPLKDFKNKSVITIGRTRDNDFVIDNIKVSRNHAKLVKENNEWFIEDLGSSNGTFVNEKKIKKSKVSLSDIVTLGGVPISISNIFEDKKEIQGDVELSAKNISFIVNNKVIIDNVSLTIKPGEFVGLIGPSGAGKTTLMMMLNGVTKPSHGSVFINSLSLYANLNSFKGQIGYVPQDDIIHRELKVEESLRYTAKLRLSGNYSNTEISSQVTDVIDTLDLKEAKDTLIGSAEKKGISGGQRKRVNLGQELLTEPSILFLDEPTSGLDPKTDMDVMHLFKKIADKGKIVVLTTHNITVENFDILTHLIVLSKGGKLAYFGPANEATNYFNVQKPYQIFDSLNGKDSSHWVEKFKQSSYYIKYITNRQNENLKVKSKIEEPSKQERKANLKQFFNLSERYLKVKLRDKVSTLILILQAPIIALLISLVFNRAEEKTQALFVLVIASIWLGCSNAAREIVSEQSIYKRERMVNLKIPSYIFSKLMVLTLLCIVQSFILTAIVHPSLDLDSSYIMLFILILTTSVSSLSIGLFVSSLVSTSEAAMGLIPIVLIPQVILGGLISIFKDMNDLIKGLSALMISRWSFEAALITEFKDKSQIVIKDQIGFSPDNLSVDYFIIILFNVVFLSLTTYSLKRKDRH